jgi:hypothetical protein
MAFTSAELLHILGFDPTDSFSRGQLMAMRQQLLGRGDYPEEALFNELLAAPSQPRPPTALKNVPWATVRPSHESQRHGLTPIQVAYLQRLTTEVEKITDDQAVTLAKWTMNAEPGSDDAKLLHLVFDPSPTSSRPRWRRRMTASSPR